MGAILCFFPLIGGMPSYLEDLPVRASVESSSYRESSYAMLGCAVPLAADLLVDIVKLVTGGKKLNSTSSSVTGFGAMNLLEKLVFICGIVVSPAVCLLPKDSRNLALGSLCAGRAQILLVGGCIVITASRGDRRVFTTPLTLIILVCLFVPNVLFGWAVNATRLYAWSIDGSEYRPGNTSAYAVRQVATILEWIAAITFVLCCLRWLYSECFVKVVTPWVVSHLRGTVRRSKGDRSSHAEHIIWFPTLYILSRSVQHAPNRSSGATLPPHRLPDRPLRPLSPA